MNEDMKKTLDHAYEVLGVTRRDVAGGITQGQVEDLINQKLSGKIRSIGESELSEKEKNQALAELRACYTMVLLDYRLSEGRSTDDIRQVHVAKAEKYAEIYQKKQKRTKEELSDKLITNMLNSVGINTKFTDVNGRVVPSKPSRWPAAQFENKLNEITFDKIIDIVAANPERKDEIKNNIKFLNNLSNMNTEQRINTCNKYIEKNKVKKAEPAKEQTQERPKNRFVEWLKKKLGRKNNTNNNGHSR